MENNMNRFFIQLQKLCAKHGAEYTLGQFSFERGRHKVAVTHIDGKRVVADKPIINNEDTDSDDDE